MYLFGFVVIVGVMSTLCMMSYVHVYYDLSVLNPLFLCVVCGYMDGVQTLGVDLIKLDQSRSTRPPLRPDKLSQCFLFVVLALLWIGLVDGCWDDFVSVSKGE